MAHILGCNPNQVNAPRDALLLQFGVFRFCCDENRNISVGVFPQGEKILVGNAGFCGISLKRIRASHSKMRECSERAILDNPPIVHQLLKSASRVAAATSGEVRLSAHVHWVEQSSYFNLVKSLPKLILACVLEQ